MSTEPVQARSIDSTSRMLDAGEELFLQGGGSQLKLNLILEKSKSSTGSFYARFGDMQGYLDALHSRALDRISGALIGVTAKAEEQNSVFDTLNTYLLELMKLLRKFEGTMFFFAVGNTNAEFRRTRGAEFTLATQASLASLITPYLANASSRETRLRLDMVGRLVIAMSFQQIMFEQAEISSLKLTDKELAHEWAATLSDSIAAFVKEEARVF